MLAEQMGLSVPLYRPPHVQVQAEIVSNSGMAGVPELHKLLAGAVSKLPPLAETQAPCTGDEVVTLKVSEAVPMVSRAVVVLLLIADEVS